VGLETMLAAVWSLHQNGDIPLARLVDAMSSKPAEILGLETGRLAPGAPADFTLVDPTLSWKVEEDTLRSRAKNSPFEHRTLEGRVVETVVAGERVYAYPRN
jgi:dihydroorotase